MSFDRQRSFHAPCAQDELQLCITLETPEEEPGTRGSASEAIGPPTPKLSLRPWPPAPPKNHLHKDHDCHELLPGGVVGRGFGIAPSGSVVCSRDGHNEQDLT